MRRCLQINYSTPSLIRASVIGRFTYLQFAHAHVVYQTGENFCTLTARNVRYNNIRAGYARACPMCTGLLCGGACVCARVSVCACSPVVSAHKRGCTLPKYSVIDGVQACVCIYSANLHGFHLSTCFHLSTHLFADPCPKGCG